MEPFDRINMTTKDEQQIALESYDALATVIGQLQSSNPEIEIEETGERIKIPLNALKHWVPF